MTHGDNNGLVLPPKIAPIQVIVVPVAQHKEGVLEKAQALYEELKALGIRAKIDTSDNSLGWKCAQYEMKGVPLRVEIGPKDIENGSCMAVRRDNREKTSVSLSELETEIPRLLDAVQKGLYDKAKNNLDENIRPAYSLEEAKELQEKYGGFVKTMWCGDLKCELDMKEKAGMSSRCIPFEQEDLGETCACCGKKAKHMIYWGVAY
jgi:prolyl-tRNA synthetase